MDNGGVDRDRAELGADGEAAGSTPAGLSFLGGPTESSSFLQSGWWFSIKAGGGWTPVRATESSTAIRSGTEEPPGALVRSLGPASLAYLPYAFPHEESIEVVAGAIRAMIARGAARPVLASWDCPWPADRFDPARARIVGFRPSPMRVQPPDTVVIDLAAGEDALLSAMKSKTRYNIRLAAKRGVRLEVVGPTDAGAERALADWYALYRATAARDRISIHPQEYYRRVFLGPDRVGTDRTVRDGGMGASGDFVPSRESANNDVEPRRELILARHEEDTLGGVVTVSYRGTTTYLYGAGADIKRNLMASYLLQWEAIRRARAAGDRWYDMFGIPPSDAPEHSMHGLYRFKTGFGGTIVHRAGLWDLPLRPVGASLIRSAQRARAWYYFSFRKRGSS